MQGTVSAFDPATGAGSLVTDDGQSLEFPAAAFENSGLRLLRPGQRVSVSRDDAAVITLVTLVGFRSLGGAQTVP